MTPTMAHTADRLSTNEVNKPLNEREFDVTMVSVSERLNNNTFTFEEIEPKGSDGYMVGIGLVNSSQEGNARYVDVVRNFINSVRPSGANDSSPEERAAGMLNFQYNVTRTLVTADDEKASFERPATYVIDGSGNLIWSANNKPGSIGLVLARNNEALEQLGTNDNTRVGVISDLSPDDALYMLPNSVIGAMQEEGLFTKDAIDVVMADQAFPADMVSVTLAEALSYAPADSEKNQDVDTENQTMSDALRRQNKNRIRDQKREKEFQDWLATLEKNDDAITGQERGKQLRDWALEHNDVVTPVDITQAFADDKELQAQIGAAQGAAGEEATLNDSTPSMGISDAVRDELEKERLAARVEKYTEKVASYEEIAAVALAKRMKGRLFNPLTRRNKEKVQRDDLDMHLLEGFSRALDGALMKQWLAEGYSDDEAAQMIYEHQQTRQEARAARNHDELRKDKLGSFLDKYANMSKGKKIGVAIGAAAAFGAIGLVAGGALGVAGGIGLASAKVGKTYLQHRSKIYETSRDDSRKSPDVVSSVSNGKAATRTAAQQVFAGMDYDEKKRETAIQKADRNKKVAAGLAAISAVALGAGVAMKVAEHGDDIQKFWNKSLTPDTSHVVGDADGSWVSEVPTPEVAPPAPAIDFSIDASTVTNGEGWYQTIQEVTGSTSPAEQAAILQKIGPALQEKGWAYPMNDGTWGISRPGTLPKDVLELIKNSR
jgi:hypothetical protein